MTGKFERHYGYVTQIICPDLQTAQYKASEEMMNTSGYVLPVVVFWQGERFTMTGALPFNYVQSRLSMRSASARASIDDVNQALNRPEIPEHSDGIAKYLLDNYNKKYILPPMTLNVQEQVRLYSVDYYNARFYPGFLVIPPTSMIAITDGQHRSRGIIRALERLSEQQRATLEHDSIAVMITCESNLDQIHQDFADCSKTKLIPQSLLAVYDRRNPANRLVIDIERLCPLFNGKVDATGKKIGSKGLSPCFR